MRTLCTIALSIVLAIGVLAAPATAVSPSGSPYRAGDHVAHD